MSKPTKPSKPTPKPGKPFPPKKVKAASAVVSNTVLATFLSPKGKEYPVSNISAFARRFNLDRSSLAKVARGERISHKSWTAKG